VRLSGTVSARLALRTVTPDAKSGLERDTADRGDPVAMPGFAMTVQTAFRWVEDTAVGTAIRESIWLFPTFESLHVLTLAAMLGTIAVVDLRLMGVASRNRLASALMKDVLPFTRVAFAVTIVTGVLLFTSNASQYVQNTPFLLKLGLLFLAFVNILVFHRLIERGIDAWDAGTPPLSARISGALSLAAWIGVVAAGRWIGFV
jgi:hypothetical protein